MFRDTAALRGLKFYADEDHAELFTGCNRSLEHYRLMKPGEQWELHEFILPTVGLTWLTHADRRGISGLYRTKGTDSLFAEFLLCAADTRPRIPVELHLRLPGRRQRRSDTLAAGDHLRTAAVLSRPGRVHLLVRAGGNTLASITTHTDSIPLLEPDQIREPPLAEILDNQSSSYVYRPEAEEDENPAPLAPDPLSFTHDTLHSLPEPPDDGHNPYRARFTMANYRDCRASAMIDSTFYVLGPDKLHIVRDRGLPKAANTAFGYNTCNPLLLDSCYTESTFVKETITIDGARWSSDITIHDDALALSVDRRLELRDTAGALIDSVPLGDWAGPLASADSQTILVSLPYRHAVAVVNLHDRTVTEHPLGHYGIAYPWAIASTPTGWAVTSAISRHIVHLSADLTAGHTVRLPAPAPDRIQFRGITAAAWHPGLEALLVNDLDNLGILRTSLDGTDVRPFTHGGTLDSTTLFVRDLWVDGRGRVMATQFYSNRNKRTQFKLFDERGGFRGGMGMFGAGVHGVANAGFVHPHDSDRFMQYNFWARSIWNTDSLGLDRISASGYGWGRGFNVHVPGQGSHSSMGMVWEPRYGCFLLDLGKHVVHRFDPSLTFIEELKPPWPENDFSPAGAVLDSQGRLHVIDGFRNAIVRFGPEPSAPDSATVRYTYQGLYGDKADMSLSRIYRHDDHIVAVDVLGLRWCRFDEHGKLAGQGTLPAGFSASIFSAPTPDGRLAIKEHRSERVVLLGAEGSVTLRTTALPEQTRMFESLARWPSWRRERRPEDATYAAVARGLDVIYLDSSFTKIGEQPDTAVLHKHNLRGFVVHGDTLIAGLRGKQGVMVVDLQSGARRWLPLDIEGDRIDILAVTPRGTIGGLTREPVEYVEFDLTGTILSRIDPLPTERVWNLSYSRAGRLMMALTDEDALVFLDRDGTEKRRLSLGNVRDVEDVLEGPDGAFYTLSWRTGMIHRIDTTGEVTVVFNGRIEGEDKRPSWCAWLELRDDGKLVFADNENGQIRVVGLDGRYYGSWGERKHWRRDMWGGHTLPDGRIAFVGRGAIHTVKIEK